MDTTLVNPLFYEACSKSQEIYIALISRVTYKLRYLRKCLINCSQLTEKKISTYLNQLNIIKSVFQALQSTLEQCFSSASTSTFHRIKRRLEFVRIALTLVSFNFERMQKNESLPNEMPTLASNTTDPYQQLQAESCQFSNFNSTEFRRFDSQGAENPNFSNDPAQLEMYGPNYDQMELESNTNEICQPLVETTWEDSDETMIDSPVKSFRTLINYVPESLNLPSSPGGAATESPLQEPSSSMETGYRDNKLGSKTKRRCFSASHCKDRYWLRKITHSECFSDSLMRSPLKSAVLPTSETIVGDCCNRHQTHVAPLVAEPNVVQANHADVTTSEATPIYASIILSKSIPSTVASPIAESVISSIESSNAAPSVTDAVSNLSFLMTVAPSVTDAVPNLSFLTTVAPSVTDAVSNLSFLTTVAPSVTDAVPNLNFPTTVTPSIIISDVAKVNRFENVFENVSRSNFQATVASLATEPHVAEVLTQSNFPTSTEPQGRKSLNEPSELQNGDGAVFKRMCFENLRHFQVLFPEPNELFSDDLLPPNFWKLPLEDIELPAEMIDEIDHW